MYSKLLESVGIRDQVMQHMFENNLFSAKQFRFIRGRSTVLQLLRVTDEWAEILDEGGGIDVI